MLDYTLGIQESLKKIFGGVLVGGIRRDNPMMQDIFAATKSNKNRFIANFPSNIFQDEFAIFYEILVGLNAFVFTVNELDTIIDNNRDLILNSPYISLVNIAETQAGTQSTDDEKVEAIKENVKELFIELSNMYVSEDEFNSACVIFSDYFRRQHLLQTAQAMTRIMSDQGYEEREPGRRLRRYSGVDDCKTYYAKNIKLLNELSEADRVRTLVVDESWLEQDLKEDGRKDIDTLMSIGITEIDSVMGDLRRGNMLGILGPPKGGKTRFTNFLVSRALSLGLNVCVWTLEGSREEWISMQLAALLKNEYNVVYNSKDILQRKYISNPKEMKLIAAARTRLATDSKRGRLSFIESTAYIEDFLDIIESHYENENPFDVIVIDQLIDILSRTGKGKVERISQAYQELKIFINTGMKRKALAIIPAQLKQSIVDMLRKNPDETIDVTAGGESAETIRSPDEVIGLFSSKEERAANLMHLYSVASRHSEAFPDFMVRANLQCCYFESDPSLN